MKMGKNIKIMEIEKNEREKITTLLRANGTDTAENDIIKSRGLNQ